MPLPPVADGGAQPDKEDAEVEAELRRCCRCRAWLPVSAFNRLRESYQWWCRECYREYFRARGPLHIRQTDEAKKRRRSRARRLVREHLAAHPCADCGETDTRVLEFDHLGPKRGAIGLLAYSGLSLAALRREIEGCEVVCANCHSRRTAVRNGSWRLAPEAIGRRGPLLPSQIRNLFYVRDALLKSGCVDCGIADLLVLECDHIGPKEANVSKLVRDGYSLARIQAEIDRCEVRCANCHRRRTKLAQRKKAATVTVGA